MIDKAEAVKLREHGNTYKEISDILGCSEVWCKKLLKGVAKGVSNEPNGTEIKLKAIEILENALKQIRGI